MIECTKSLDNKTLATAFLGKLLYKYQLILLKWTSYRIPNRQKIS